MNELTEIAQQRNPRAELIIAVGDRLTKAYEKHGSLPWGRHEFYGILKEEVDELWDAIKADEPNERVLEELVDVVVCMFRYYETGDRYRGDHPKL